MRVDCPVQLEPLPDSYPTDTWCHRYKMDDDLHPVVRTVMGLLTFAVVGFALWGTFVAFVGGTMPLLGWELEGSVGQGLFWLFVVDPIVTSVGFWIAMLIRLPLDAVFPSRR
jgi:hypothetical protein